MTNENGSAILWIFMAVVLFAALGTVTMQGSRTSSNMIDGEQASSIATQVISTGTAQAGGPFQLVDQDGRPVDQTMLEGKWSLVFFGFTYCPDFCPTTFPAASTCHGSAGPARTMSCCSG